MTYEYHDAYTKPVMTGRGCRQTDLQNLPVDELFQQYRQAVIVIESPMYDELKYWWIEDTPYDTTFRLSTLPLDEFLKSLDNVALPLRDEKPPLDGLFVRYQDARMCGFKVEAINRDYNQNLNQGTEYLNDLALTRDWLDYSGLANRILPTVNGFVHRPNETGRSLNILDGARSGFHANSVHVGLLDFQDVATFQVVDIERHHVDDGTEEDGIGKRPYIKLDSSAGDLTDKSVLIVIGGYVHLPDGDVVRYVGERRWAIDMTRFSWPQRFYDMQAHIDTTPMTQHWQTNDSNPSHLDLDDLYSDETLIQLMTLPQSFFVVVDTPELYSAYDALEYAHLPNRFISYLPPVYPIVAGANRIHDYWFHWEHDRYVVATQDVARPKYFFETTAWGSANGISNARYGYDPIDPPQAFYWRLGKPN